MNKLEKSILCTNLENFRLVLKKLSSLNYVDGRNGQIGENIDTIGLSEYHFNLGIRVINLYDNKTIKYSIGYKVKNAIKDTEFLKK